MTEIQTGACADCGSSVEREILIGLGAEFFNALPLICADCQGRKELQWEQEEREADQRRARDEHQRRVGASELPVALRAVDLDRLDPGAETAIAAARAWAARGGGLLFTGPFGVGKTTIAAGALRLVLERRSGRWASAPLLMARLGSGFGTTDREKALGLITRMSALVLDDLDKTRPTEYGAEQIFLLIDGAVSNDRPLLVTTNLTLGQLAAKWPAPFGEAIASRLAGYCAVVEINGGDHRLSHSPNRETAT